MALGTGLSPLVYLGDRGAGHILCFGLIGGRVCSGSRHVVTRATSGLDRPSEKELSRPSGKYSTAQWKAPRDTRREEEWEPKKKEIKKKKTTHGNLTGLIKGAERKAWRRRETRPRPKKKVK